MLTRTEEDRLLERVSCLDKTTLINLQIVMNDYLYKGPLDPVIQPTKADDIKFLIKVLEKVLKEIANAN
jgi:hypothetical protein